MKHNLRFPKTFWDDFPFNLSVVENLERVVVTSKQYYHFSVPGLNRKPPPIARKCIRKERKNMAGSCSL